MGRYQLIFITICFLLLSLSAKSQISASVTEGCAPLASVVFTHSYTNPTNILWNFDDGGTSNLPAPVHSFALAGVYNVTFTANVSGSPVSANITITVFANPQASFTVSPEGVCLGQSVQFQDNSVPGGTSTITGWQWALGNGSTSNAAAPTVTYANAGTYNVTLIVTNSNGCTGSQTQPAAVAVSQPPNMGVVPTPNPIVACTPPLNVTFQNNSTSNSPLTGALTYTWNFGNGETSTLANPPAVTYTDEGTATITVTATDDIGCTATQSFPVSIQEPVADFIVLDAENDTVCTTITIVNNGTPGGSFNYGDGTSGPFLTHTYTTEGFKTITYTISSQGCSDQATQTIYVEIPTAQIIADPGFACFKPVDFDYSLDTDYNIASYNWQLGDGTTSTDPNPSGVVDYEGPNEYAINGLKTEVTFVEFTTVNGCVGTAFTIDSLALPNALFHPDVTQGCAPLTVNFDDESSYLFQSELVSWQWNYGDGATLSQPGSTNPTHTYTTAGEYEAFLIVTTASGCIDTSFIHIIEVGEELSPSFTFEPQTICPGETVTITNTSPDIDLIDSYAYAGDNGTMFHCKSEDSPEWIFDEIAGVYPITQTVEYNGCLSTFSQDITVLGPVGKISYGCNCDTPLDYTFDAEVSEADHWTWDFGDGTVIDNSTSTFQSHSYTASGDYTATLTTYSDASGCEPYTHSVLVKVRQLAASLSLIDRTCAGSNPTLSAINLVDVGDDQNGCHRNYLWEFGDGTRPIKTVGPTTNHVFAQGGDFTVTLSVKDDNECVVSTTAEISVFAIQAAYAADTLYGCPPLEVNFSDLTNADTTVVSWVWSFGDGQSSEEPNPTHTYSNPVFGANNQPLPYTVGLVVTDALGCTDAINTLVIQPLGPNPNFIATSATQICEGSSVNFAPSGSNPNFHTYAWDYGNDLISAGPNGSAIFDAPGVYTITLTVSDSLDCSRESSQSIVQVQGYPEAIISPDFNENEILCYPIVATFTDASVVSPFGSRAWDLGLGGPPLTNPVVGTSYLLPGTFDVELIVNTTFGCADTTVLEFVVKGPLAEIDLQPNAICPGGSILLNLTDTTDLAYWNFDFGDGNEEANQLPTEHTYDPTFIPSTGQTILTLVMFSPDSACSAARTIPLSIEEVIAGFDRNNESTVIDSVHCFGVPDYFINTSSPNATSYSWSYSTGQTSGAQNPAPVTLPAGEHTIQLIVQSNLGCRDTIIKEMEIFALPEPTATGGTICRGESVTLVATGGEQYSWFPEESLDNPFNAVVNASPLSSTTYTVLVTDTNDCQNTTSSYVLVYQPAPSVEEDTILRIGDSDWTGLDLGPGYTYQWSPDIYLDCATCPITSFTPLENTLYTLTISDTTGCFNVQSYFYYEILEVASVDLPDAFTPNGDGINDIVYVRGWGIESMVSFRIYNRWGELIFETSDLHQGWDGTYKGELQNADSYAYVVVVKNYIREGAERFKGFIDLVR